MGWISLLLKLDDFKKTKITLRIHTHLFKEAPITIAHFKRQKSLITTKIIPQDIYLRYNANTDELEMSSYQHRGETDQMLLPDTELKATIGSETFYFRPYYSNTKNTTVANGYFIKLTEGHPYQLYFVQQKCFEKPKSLKHLWNDHFQLDLKKKSNFITKGCRYPYRDQSIQIIPYKSNRQKNCS